VLEGQERLGFRDVVIGDKLLFLLRDGHREIRCVWAKSSQTTATTMELSPPFAREITITFRNCKLPE
jgi:hypothetical protein